MALLFQPKLAQGLTAKALQFINENDYEQAVVYLEMALKYNPNSALVINTLSELYTNHIPDTEKYLEYALKGVSLDIASNDSSTASFIYLHLSNALVQTGFVNEAYAAIEQSLKYKPDNLFSAYVKAYVLYARDKDLDITQTLVLEALSKDTTRIDIIQEAGNVFYLQRDWASAHKYFQKFLQIKTFLQLDIYTHKNAEIALVFDKMGFNKQAESLLNEYKNFADNDQSIYQHLNLASYYSYTGNKEKALYHLELFSNENNYQYWVPLFIPDDPIMDNIKNDPAFKRLMDKIETNFWINHERLKARLIEANLLPN
jgi:tetratricopeptide (TPR) repeat protein